MARIKKYQLDEEVNDKDLLVGTDRFDFNKTKNYKLETLKDYFQQGSSSSQDLGYVSSPTQGEVTITNGNDATIPLADDTNAGLLSPTEKQQIASAIQPDDLADVAISGDYDDLINTPTPVDISGLVPYIGATQNVDITGFALDNTKYVLFDSIETESPIPNQKGLLYYDSEKDVLVFQDAEENTLDIGQELLVRCRNNTGSTIVNGSVVYISGAVSQNPIIALAQADTLDSSRLIGVVTQDIDNNSLGKVCVFGTVDNIDTSDFNDGDEVYLSASIAGGLTATPPSNFVSYIGIIEYAHFSQGKLLVRPQKTLGNNNSLGTSQIIPPTQNAVKSYVDTGLSGKQNTLGFTPENVANKATTLGSPNNDDYPTTLLLSETKKYGKVTTNATVSGTYNIDLASDVDTYNLTLTGATTFTISNAPSGDKVRIITMRITGNHAITWWSGVNPTIVANYVGTAINKVVVEAFSGIYDVQLTQI